MKRHTAGFTLVELVIVIVVLGVLASGFMAFFRPLIDGYFDARRRADLTDIADTALRRVAQDVRRAVPNSLNLIDATTVGDGSACLQLVPTVGGGRYRKGIDLTNDDATCPGAGDCAAFPDASALASAVVTFDVLLARFSGAQAALQGGNVIVVNNQNGNDVYDGSSRATVTAVAPVPKAAFGMQRVTLSRNPMAGGYDGGSFQVVAAGEPSVVYTCTNGRLRRSVGAFARAAACPAGGDVLATDVLSCEFLYQANMGGEQSGYLWMTLALGRGGEAISLAHGVHVDNVP
ncbi:MAG: prepilin-type N-terminal cleavage/methylation domain-containing protein [Rhodocyclaceae bacterium]|nr:prepilin-type N-terminal cleavage/methylation domain-containing protein [Rhodocyclaceae bacterium]